LDAKTAPQGVNIAREFTDMAPNPRGRTLAASDAVGLQASYRQGQRAKQSFIKKLARAVARKRRGSIAGPPLTTGTRNLGFVPGNEGRKRCGAALVEPVIVLRRDT